MAQAALGTEVEIEPEGMKKVRFQQDQFGHGVLYQLKVFLS